MLQELRASLALLLLFTILTGAGYPALVTTLGQSLFPYQAGGSLAERDGTIIGSELIGQTFVSDKYFRGRPSAAGGGYDASNSSGSNLSPTSADLLKTIGERVAEWKQLGDHRAIPVDLVTSSASGLDPDISLAAAAFQAPHVAIARGVSTQQVQTIITNSATPRSFGILGEARVNVLALNRALDRLLPVSATPPASTAPSSSNPSETPSLTMPLASEPITNSAVPSPSSDSEDGSPKQTNKPLPAPETADPGMPAP